MDILNSLSTWTLKSPKLMTDLGLLEGGMVTSLVLSVNENDHETGQGR